ncbi:MULTISPECIES: GntR family transcriptional regulator [unclassified Pseudomonas]|uniref:GntR family transcriptional regulator n=3 Tax=Pseudomonas TaxID=286 RepID=A0AA37R6R1_PSEPU|nr:MULTISPECIES: GntR family transcriptional regulator [unclassified Pseudomonas]PRN02897.1 GntR family transcriptional regulator [Pseudomonas sp. LLC-1]GLO14895.1 GntR family transcriptional regulator [Pseudomonas putida]MDR2316851.1 GntR family transcriptional regulator [Pseudomonas sp.]GLO34692.1 GntR family transcriptional regulator [Pseudomonas putida]HDS0964767.1 GntR family transcriptional regulator [Pseudomonas putida]
MMTKDNDKESGVRRHSGRYIYEELRKQILTLKLKPGVQLDEVSLAAQFGLSRSPVRDALARLITEGLVVILPNRTTLVTPFEIEEFPNYISALDLMQRAVTRLAAIQHRPEDLEKIRQADAEYLKAVTSGDFQSMSELNKAFHMAIAHAGRNPYFINYYERLLGEGQRLLHLHFDHIVSSASTHKLGRDHDEIIDAIAARDADAAEAAAHEHTMLFQRRFLDYMQQNLTARMSVA